MARLRPAMAIAAVALILPAIVGHAAPPSHGPQVGDTYEIIRDKETSQKTSLGGTSRARDRDTIVERVIGARDGGLELEYDLPGDATAQDRARSWQFPARIFKPSQGASQLLNGPAMEVRVEGWLKAAQLDRTACGRWIFTWNAFRIECDPQSVIPALEQFELGPDDLRDGAAYRDPRARESAPVTRKATGADGATFVVEMAVDPDQVRRGHAETDVVVAQLQGKTLSLEDAVQARQADDIAGTITTTFETDSAGRVRRRTTVAKVETKKPNGQLEDQTVTETVERKLIVRRN
jgi:hypothetical protein